MIKKNPDKEENDTGKINHKSVNDVDHTRGHRDTVRRGLLFPLNLLSGLGLHYDRIVLSQT